MSPAYAVVEIFFSGGVDFCCIRVISFACITKNDDHGGGEVALWFQKLQYSVRHHLTIGKESSSSLQLIAQDEIDSARLIRRIHI
jgi:hypothetical protein